MKSERRFAFILLSFSIATATTLSMTQVARAQGLLQMVEERRASMEQAQATTPATVEPVINPFIMAGYGGQYVSAPYGAYAGAEAAHYGAVAGTDAARYGAAAGVGAAHYGAEEGQQAARYGAAEGATAAHYGAAEGAQAARFGAAEGASAAHYGADHFGAEGARFGAADRHFGAEGARFGGDADRMGGAERFGGRRR